MKDGSRRCQLVLMIRDEWPGSHGNDAMRDKVEHPREEVNADSRRCEEFATELAIRTALQPPFGIKRPRPISKQYRSGWHILRGLCARIQFGRSLPLWVLS